MQSAKVWRFLTFKKEHAYAPIGRVKALGTFYYKNTLHVRLNVPDCCDDGWRITLAGSRFLSGAEERYAANEGEAFAIAWGLEQTLFHTGMRLSLIHI